MNESKQRRSGSQRKGVSKGKEGREKGKGVAKKKRGSKVAATRANVWREDTKKTEEVGRRQTGPSRSTNKNNVKLSFEENVGIMDERTKRYDGITQAQVKTNVDNQGEEFARSQQVAAE